MEGYKDSEINPDSDRPIYAKDVPDVLKSIAKKSVQNDRLVLSADEDNRLKKIARELSKEWNYDTDGYHKMVRSIGGIPDDDVSFVEEEEVEKDLYDHLYDLVLRQYQNERKKFIAVVATGSPFRQLVTRHEELTRQIAKAEKSSTYKFNDKQQENVRVLNEERRAVHDQLRAIGEEWNLNDADIVNWLMMEHGDLKEFGLDAPLIVGGESEFQYNDEARVGKGKVMIVYGSWSNYTNNKYEVIGQNTTHGYSEALKAAMALVKDYPEIVESFSVNNGGVHSGAGSDGVRLSAGRLNEIVKIIRRNPEKYWY